MTLASWSSSYALGMVSSSGLLFGLMLLAAIAGGYAARFVHVPRVVGFLLGGIALRLILHALFVPEPGGPEEHILQSAAEPLSAIRDLALGMILFSIGGVFQRSRFKNISPAVLRIGLLEIISVVVLVFVGCLIAALVSPARFTGPESLLLAGLLALAAIATAPAATLFVLQEYDAKGPITNTILALTGVNNFVCIILFYSVFFLLASVGAVQTRGVLDNNLWVVLAATTVGSVSLGIVCGTLISIIHAKLALAETVLIFMALFILLGAGEPWFFEHLGVSYNFLLTALVMGAVFANIAIDTEKLVSSLRTLGSPIFAGFFVMAGYDTHVAELAHMGLLGAAYVLARGVGKVIGARVGVRWAQAPERADGRLGTALLCQAAVVIGLASFVRENWDSHLANVFATVILGSVIVFELVGPLLVKRCVVHGGEVKAISLIRRGGRTAEGGGVVRLTLRALARLFGLRFERASDDGSEMRVKHIMRAHVQFIRASDSLDDVLQFIERSTYNHFAVVDEAGKFVGVIHFGDVRNVIYDPVLCELVRAVDLVDADAAVVPVDMPLDELLKVFTSHNVGVLPVVEHPDRRRIVGVVEQRDLLRALHLSQTPR